MRIKTGGDGWSHNGTYGWSRAVQGGYSPVSQRASCALAQQGNAHSSGCAVSMQTEVCYIGEARVRGSQRVMSELPITRTGRAVQLVVLALHLSHRCAGHG